MTKGKTLTGPALIAGAILAAGLIVGWMVRPQSEYDRQMQYLQDMREHVTQGIHDSLEKLPAYRKCEQDLAATKSWQDIAAKYGRENVLVACMGQQKKDSEE